MIKIISIALLSIFSTITIAQEKNEVVATVNNVKIFKSTLEKNYQENQLYLSHKTTTRRKVLFDLINRELGIQKAKSNKLDQNEIVVEKINDILYHAQISQDLEPLFKKITVSDSEVQNFYNKNKEYRTSHILFRLKANPSKDEVKSALEMAYTLYNQIKQTPEKFSTFANKYSQSSAAPTGGDIGFQPPTRLAPEYFNAINGKPVDFITEPVKTQFGIHIIKILGIKPYKEINADMYKKIIYDTKRDKIIDAYFEKSRTNANIIINEKLALEPPQTPNSL